MKALAAAEGAEPCGVGAIDATLPLVNGSAPAVPWSSLPDWAC